MARKKLLIITGIYPPDVGGPATFVPLFCDEISKYFFIEKVITGTNSKKKSNDIFIFSPKGKFFFIRKFQIIFEIIKSIKKVDLIFLNGLELEFHIINFFYKKKYILKFSGDRIWEKLRNLHSIKAEFGDFSQFKLSFTDNLIKKIYQNFLKNADKVIVPGFYLKKYLCTKYLLNENKIIHINNFVKNKNDNLNTLEKKYDFIYIGRFVKHKNIEQIIEFTKKFSSKNLLIIGEGPLEAKLSSLKSERINIMKSIKQNEVQNYLSSSNYLIINSDYEGLSHTILEAWRSGCIVLAKNNIGNLELLSNNNELGLLYENLNSIEFFKKFKLLDEDKEKQNKIINNCFFLVHKKYNYSNLEIYSKVTRNLSN